MPVTIDDVKDRATITAAEAAQLLDCSEQSIYRSVRKDYLPNIRLGRKVVIPVRPLLDMLGHSQDEHRADVCELRAVHS